jgi:CheY-like chemotaxis protein
VLVNLVSNAIKFTPQGHVGLHAHWQPNSEDCSKGTLVIEVEDSGIGISPEKHEAIFQPFIQAASQQHLETQGTGLGLSIVQRLTSAMGGKVSLHSAPGAGAAFSLRFTDVFVSSRLPVTDVPAAETPVNFNDFSPATILVVDDNQINRNLVSSLFADTHHTLRLAANGREALVSIAETKPEIVLLDIRMPVMDGRATLTEIRRQPGLELLPIIAVTASSHADDEPNLQCRFSGFIRKPFSRKTLYQELAQFLPRIPQADNVRNGGAASAGTPVMPATVRTTDTQVAIAELLSLHREQWPRLRDTLAINETLAFAQKLRHLGQAMQSQPLTIYADRLAADAEAYAVKDLERSLAEFPALVNSFSQPGESA